MAEENTGIVEGQGAADQPEGKGAETPTPASQEEISNAFKTLTTKVKGLSAQLESVNNENAILKSQKAQPAAIPEAQKAELFEGMDAEDFPTVKQLKAEMEKLKPGQQVDPGLLGKVTELELRLEDSNYKETIAENLPGIIKQMPAVRDTILQIQDPAQRIRTALMFAKMNPDYRAEKRPETDRDQQVIDQIIKNTMKPGSSAEVGGGVAIATANRYSKKNMSDEEFAKEFAANVSGAG